MNSGGKDSAGVFPLHQHLREEIQKKLGVDVVTSRFFSNCAAQIFAQEHVRVSTSTLKRYWRYVHIEDDYMPNHYTLDILARFAGYSSWKSFCRGEECSESARNHQERLNSLHRVISNIEAQIAQLQDDVNEIRRLLEDYS